MTTGMIQEYLVREVGMHITEVIQKKRDGGALLAEEIKFFIEGYSREQIPDYQASALLMAIWFRGMDSRETTDLTLAMAESGDQIDLSAIEGVKVDKHSTGGVADTTTLVAVPLAAACGVKVAKMSGRGLGHTGGTLDKLEAIPGVSVNVSMKDFFRQVSAIGLAVIGQTADLVPADKKLYALRDVTATIDNMSLIAASIMSKKLAAGSDAIVLDVKTGSGAFMQQTAAAVELAQTMVRIGNMAGRETCALVTDMNQPLGYGIGNAIEVEEAIDILTGKSGGDLKTVSLRLAARMLILADRAESEGQALTLLEGALASGKGLEKLKAMIEWQGGNPRVCDDTGLLPKAAEKIPVKARESGFVQGMDNAAIGISALLLGAGRLKKTDVIDPAVGLWMRKRLGEAVKKGEILAELHVNDRKNLDEAVNRITAAVHIGEEEIPPPELVYEYIGERS